MARSPFLWFIAFVLTVAVALFQRMTGPTHPVSGDVAIGSSSASYTFLRNHESGLNAPVRVAAPDPAVGGILRWKRFRVEEPWADIAMDRSGADLVAGLPAQPPAGKVEYRVVLRKGGEEQVIPSGAPVVLRYRGAVPLWVLLPHIAAMFTAMLLSTRSGLETFRPAPRFGGFVLWTISLLAAGGLVLGPVAQWYAFGEFWTGWPLGTDLTDNKTAVAMIGWLAALVALRRSSRPGRWVLGAAVLLLVVYLIPHSMLGTELDYMAKGGRP